MTPLKAGHWISNPSFVWESQTDDRASGYEGFMSDHASPLQRFSRFILVLAILAALYGGWNLRWLCDDAFISYRYAEHFAQGHGLVFNVGEAVEGYTNFLWTVVLGILHLLGWEMEMASVLLGLFCWALALVGLAVSPHSSLRLCAPLMAACCLHLRIFATSGLETMAFLAAIIWLINALEKGCPKRVAGLGLTATLIRPEGALFAVAAALCLRVDSEGFQKSIKALLFLTLGIVPWLLWKWSVYGDLLPNTFYAKASDANWTQGVHFLGLFFKMYWFFGVGFLMAFLLLKTKRRRLGVYTLTVSLLLGLHIARSGGGFMFARLCLPLLPALILSMDALLTERAEDPQRIWLSLGFAATVLYAPYPEGLDRIQGREFGIGGVIEERSFYPPSVLEQAKSQGETLRVMLENSDVRTVIYGGQAMIAYHAKLPYVLEGTSGLTDTSLARMPAKSKRIGHGDKADAAVLAERNIDLSLRFRHDYPRSPLSIAFSDNVQGDLHQFRPELMAQLREKGAIFPDLPAVIDQSIASLHEKSAEEIQQEFAYYKRTYFQFNDDERRQQPFKDALGQ